MNELDRLFNDKLSNHAVEPSTAAWQQIEGHLSGKKPVVLWRWAAAVLLGGLLVGGYWLLRPTEKLELTQTPVQQPALKQAPVPTVKKREN
jgi:hypothetical protein